MQISELFQCVEFARRFGTAAGPLRLTECQIWLVRAGIFARLSADGGIVVASKNEDKADFTR
jgi:hypothetical protein